MARRKRRFSRVSAGSKGGRQFFWFRFAPFGMTLENAASAIHSDILLEEADWQNPTANLNEAQRGGPRLERLICEYGLSVEAENAFWRTAGNGNVALIPEFMIWKQSSQFGATVTDLASFNATRHDQRVLMDEVPQEKCWQFVNGDQSGSIRTVQGRYETRSKVRLADSAIGVGWAGRFDTGAATLRGYTDWFRPTLLISVP